MTIYGSFDWTNETLFHNDKKERREGVTLSDPFSRVEGPGWNAIEQGRVSDFIDPIDTTMIYRVRSLTIHGEEPKKVLTAKDDSQK